MPTIVFVDDRPAERSTIAHTLRRRLRRHTGWVVEEVDPLEDLHAYSAFLIEREAAVLVIDQRLNEQRIGGSDPVAYSGADVVELLRTRMPDFPIFMISAALDSESERIEEVDPLVESFAQKADVERNPGAFVERMVRAGQRFAEAHRAQLSRLSELATSVATGQSTQSEIAEMKAIQEALSIPFSDELSRRAEVHSALDAISKDLDSLLFAVRSKRGKGETE